ncbi:MAG: hypothetical protein QOC98_533 [Frankiaceae bacterium]|nr:hypothetical protein [Frankiaceae bacterium]
MPCASPDPRGSPAPRIAVVVPCFDDGAVLVEAVTSLRDQEPCEVVVVDDGSNDDGTLEVLRALEAQGVTVVHQANQGPSAARNTGVAVTTAPYVFPLDADDAVFPQSLTALADVLDRDPELAVVWGRSARFGKGLNSPPGPLRVDQLDPWRITYLNEIPGAALIRRTALAEVSGWRDGTGYEDWDLWLALAEHGHRGRGVDVPVQRYRLHGSRRWEHVSSRHGRVYAELRAAHTELWKGRRRHWLASQSSWRARLLLPAADALPMSRRGRWRLFHVLLHTRRVLRDDLVGSVKARWRRRWGATGGPSGRARGHLPAWASVHRPGRRGPSARG